MIKVTPALALILFVIILVVSAIIAYWMQNYNRFDGSGFHTFIVVLGGLGVFVTFMFYFSIVSLQQQQQELNEIHETNRFTDVLIENMYNSMNDSSSKIPNFVASLNPLTFDKCQMDKDKQTIEAWTEKIVLSHKIFTVWQESLLSNKFVRCDAHALIVNFLLKASSKQLYEQWLIYKINFNKCAQKFGDLLFDYGLNIKNKTSEEYSKIAYDVMNDMRFGKCLCD